MKIQCKYTSDETCRHGLEPSLCYWMLILDASLKDGKVLIWGWGGDESQDHPNLQILSESYFTLINTQRTRCNNRAI